MEQRRHKRLPAAVRIFARTPGSLFSEPVKDLSLGGAQVVTESPLAVGTQSTFALQLPHHDAPLELAGKVVWARAGAMGLAFDAPSPRLSAFVDKLERDATRL